MTNPFGRAFWRGFFSMVAYGASHSLLASPGAKQAARRLVGERAFGTYYRVGYNVFVAVTFLWLLLALLKKPGPTVYEARGAAKWAMRLVGFASLLYAGMSAWQVGLGRLSGVGPALRGLAGGSESDPPEGQNPSFAHGAPRGGPFARHRHPLNFIAPTAFWCFSRGSQGFIGLNTALTLYSIVGSYLTDGRMRARYGKAYEKYQARVPFLWPRLGRGHK